MQGEEANKHNEKPDDGHGGGHSGGHGDAHDDAPAHGATPGTPQGNPTPPPGDEQARGERRQRQWQELTSPQVLLLLCAGVLGFAGLGMPVPHLHWLIGAGLGAGLFYAPRLPRFRIPGALCLIALGAALLATAVAWLPHGFLSEANSSEPPPSHPLFLDDEVYPRKAFEIVVAGAAALMHGVLVLAWNLWGRGRDGGDDR